MTEAKIEIWIKAGYKILGTEGIDGIKVERLARDLRLNKSGFYHYFGGMKSYLKTLLHYHIKMAQDIAQEISGCDNIDPDLLLLIVKHKAFFLVESELTVKRKSLRYFDDCDAAGRMISQQLLPLWRKDNDLPDDTNVALAYLDIGRRFFYTRIDPRLINYEFLHALNVETMKVLRKVADNLNTTSSDTKERSPHE